MPPSAESVSYDNALLQEFKGTKHYEVWSKYLELMAQDWEGRLLNGSEEPHTKLCYFQGILAGLKMAQDVPQAVAMLDKWHQSQSGTKKA